MSLQLSDLPNTSARPVGTARSVVRRRLIANTFGRRALFKGAFVSVSAVALATFEGALIKVGAAAVPATWVDCDNWQPLASNGWWTECNPYASEYSGGTIGNDQIGATYCGSDDYHRTDSIGTGSGRNVHYERRPTSCADRNAWTWKIQHNTGWQNKRARRCSDGRRRVTQDGDLVSIHHTVCEKRFPGEDPPASTLPFNQYTPDGCPPANDNPNDNPAKCS